MSVSHCKMEACRVLCVLIPLINLVCGNVPVLLWESTKTDSVNSFPALTRISREDFLQYVLKKVHRDKPLPMVVMFREETLSMEDFSWQDSKGQGYFTQLKALTENAGNLEFLSSVQKPIEVIEKLQKYGYPVQSVDSDNALLAAADDCSQVLIVKMREPTFDEDRAQLLRGHDSNMVDLFSKLQSKCSHIIGMLSGIQSSWVVREEVRRMRREIDNNSSSSSTTPAEPSPSNSSVRIDGKPIYRDGQGLALVFSNSYPKLIVDKAETTLGEKNEPTSTADNSKLGIIKLSVRYNDGEKKITFNFDNSTWFGYWTLKSVSLENNTEPNSPVILKPSIEIYAPLGQSFHSGTPVKFTNGSIVLEFSSLQLQPFFLNKGSMSFGDAVDAVYFFTPAIWSGLFVTFLLILIFTWGITMIMDIRTMDQFDDPKGKTITVSNTE